MRRRPPACSSTTCKSERNANAKPEFGGVPKIANLFVEGLVRDGFPRAGAEELDRLAVLAARAGLTGAARRAAAEQHYAEVAAGLITARAVRP